MIKNDILITVVDGQGGGIGRLALLKEAGETADSHRIRAIQIFLSNLG